MNDLNLEKKMAYLRSKMLEELYSTKGRHLAKIECYVQQALQVIGVIALTVILKSLKLKFYERKVCIETTYYKYIVKKVRVEKVIALICHRPTIVARFKESYWFFSQLQTYESHMNYFIGRKTLSELQTNLFYCHWQAGKLTCKYL